MTPCPKCNRHVREASCPFCGEKCMQNARVRIVGRVARATMFATAAVTLSECGGGKIPKCFDDLDACVVPQDAGNDVNSVPFYGGSCPGNFCPDASDDADAKDDAAD